MKYFILLISLILFSYNLVFANGIGIVNAEANTYLQLESTDVQVTINNQIATVVSTQTFINNTDADTLIKFGFPMTETASALSIRWQNYGIWYEADLSPEPQDTILPGENPGVSIDSDAKYYLGDYPLYFDLEQYIPQDSSITFEVTYVDLLPYAFNEVTFFHANDYLLIQETPLVSQQFTLQLLSDRSIETIVLQDFTDYTTIINQNEASLELHLENTLADTDFEIRYSLSADELGLYDFSTFINDSLLMCDTFGEGYLAFIIEPDPSENTEVIEKVFTLVIDRSGSMEGDKIVQARNAASFIVNNLNQGDQFNVIAFDDNIISFQTDHVPYTVANQNAALAFIDGLVDDGATNISGAFSIALHDFANSDPNKANILIFFTDGEATAGITDTNQLLAHVQAELANHNVSNLSIFTFGIGDNVNQQLLTLMALQNNGLVEFLGDDELEELLSLFYLTIQNPVLLNTTMSFDPPIITETYPRPLPNLFKGQQLIVVGRYATAQDVEVIFEGTAFGQPVTYNYTLSLADTTNQSLAFLPRLWAKRKMEHLFHEFYSLPQGTNEAMMIEDSTVQISLCFGVVSPFTSFTDNTNNPTTTEVSDISTARVNNLIVSPNPFQHTTRFLLELEHPAKTPIQIQIIDATGKIIRTIELANIGNQVEFQWDGLDEFGQEVPNNLYLIKAIIDGKIWIGKVIKI